ncbi:carboxypeptidase-like regulatory domain-containing protein [Streptomyces sp. NPDC093261]|uniref:carboxypeptidase-like regulatory domain-containing protein n=1 Tax=Streptomyces sp. NPDC093261 TaxID=3366037 RepID=UPI003813B438
MTLTQRVPGLPWATAHPFDYGDDHAHFDITAWPSGDGATVTSVTARFYPLNAPADAAPVLTVTDLEYLNSGVWRSPTPVVLPAFGAYRVALDVRDDHGYDVTLPKAGTVEYQQIVHFSAYKQSVPPDFDFDHRTVTVHGALTLTDPGTGQVSPFSGATVSVYNNSAGYSRTATTAADGTFTISLDAEGAIQTTGEYEPGREDSWTHTHAYAYLSRPDYPTSEPTRIRLTSPPDVNVPAGGSATVTGVVERKVGGGWVPAPKTVVSLSEAQTGHVPYVSDDQGELSIPVSQAGAFQLAVQATDFLQQSPAEDIHVHIPQPGAQFTGLGISQDATGHGRITGHLTLGQAGPPPTGTTVQVQYSADGRTWRNAATTTVGRQGLSRDQFLCDVRQGSSANGYWRVSFLGNRDWLPVTTKAVYLWRTPTRITGGKPSTMHPAPNQKLSFSGSLQQSSAGAWHGYGHAIVQLWFQPTGSKTWRLMSTATTDSRGQYSLGAKDPRSGTWYVAYQSPDTHHLDSASVHTWVGVK